MLINQYYTNGGSPFVNDADTDVYSVDRPVLASYENGTVTLYSDVGIFAPRGLDNAFSGMGSLVTGLDQTNVPSGLGGNLSNMYSGDTAFNSAVIIPKGVTNASHICDGCENWNAGVTIYNGQGSTLKNMAYAFRGVKTMRQTVSLPESVTDCTEIFANSRCNVTATIGGNAYRAFYNAREQNRPVTIHNGTVNMAEAFSNCSVFGQNITVPDSVTDMTGCYNRCSAITQSHIGNNVRKLNFAYNGCTRLASVPDIIAVIDAVSAFSYCTALTAGKLSPTIINGQNMYASCNIATVTGATSQNGTANFDNAFASQRSASINLTIGHVASARNICTYARCGTINGNFDAINMDGAFSGAWANTADIAFGSHVASASNLFASCLNLNSPINLPGAAKLDNALRGCTNFNSPVTIPEGPQTLSNMLMGCVNFGQDISLPSTIGLPVGSSGGIYGMLNRCDAMDGHTVTLHPSTPFTNGTRAVQEIMNYKGTNGQTIQNITIIWNGNTWTT